LQGILSCIFALLILEEIKTLAVVLKEQASQIQKVSDQLEASIPTPQLMADNQ